jgi:hypothetical protein
MEMKLVFDQLQNSFLLMMKPSFFKSENVDDITGNLSILDILPPQGYLSNTIPVFKLFILGLAYLC